MFAMVLSRVLSSGAVQGAPDHVCYWAVSRSVEGAVQGAVQGAPDHVCDWVVSELSTVLSRVLSKVLSRVLRIMFVIGWCQGAVRMDL